MPLPGTIDGPALLTAIALPATGYKATNQRKIIAEFGAAVPLIIAEAGLSSELRLAHFLAQATHENDSFCTLEEYASGSAYEGRVDLGNVKPGDGRRFKGRGGFHTTGRANYGAFTAWLRVQQPDCPDFVADPEAVADLPWAAWTGIWYWDWKGMNRYADADDLLTITRRVNGGTNGLDQRRLYLGRARAAIAALTAASLPPDAAGRGTVRYGSAGGDVEMLQRALRTSPLKATLGVDGLFGAETRHWVRTFQHVFCLVEDGIVGKATWAALAPYIED